MLDGRYGVLLVLRRSHEPRKKVGLAPIVFTEEHCGVPDSALADVLVWDVKGPGGVPILQFRFCPWCGASYTWDKGKIIIGPGKMPEAPDDG